MGRFKRNIVRVVHDHEVSSVVPSGCMDSFPCQFDEHLAICFHLMPGYVC